MRPESYDLVVIGGGPAGISGANTASIFGKRVALVEKLREIGGAGINTGTIPSKTLRETALALSGVRSQTLWRGPLAQTRGDRRGFYAPREKRRDSRTPAQGRATANLQCRDVSWCRYLCRSQYRARWP